MKCNKYLSDISIIRPVCIFLLVVYHAFIIYQGGWEVPYNFKPITAYWWISKASYAFMLELFVFISGYVFALSLQKKETSFRQLLNSKLRRLIIPSIIFSIVYYFMFLYTGKFHILHFSQTILSGAGHMWFLPMLFWVTLLSYTIDSVKYIPNWLKIISIGSLPILSVLPIPFQINVALYYVLFFYLGILIFRKKTYIKSHFCNNARPAILWGGVFCITFIGGTLFIRDIPILYTLNDSLIIKGIVLIIQKYVMIIYALSGIACIYLLTNYYIFSKNINLPSYIIELNTICFGIYLFQQFILKTLYYNTNLPSIVGPYWLPWLGVFITLLLSISLTIASRQSRIGRYILG